MALYESALLELLAELELTEVRDWIRIATETLYQELIDAGAAALVGAAPCERTEARPRSATAAERTLTTTASDLEFRIPKMRTGSFFQSLLEWRRRDDHALFAVVKEVIRPGRVDPQGRRVGQGPRRRHRNLEVGGVAYLR